MKEFSSIGFRSVTLLLALALSTSCDEEAQDLFDAGDGDSGPRDGSVIATDLGPSADFGPAECVVESEERFSRDEFIPAIDGSVTDLSSAVPLSFGVTDLPGFFGPPAIGEMPPSASSSRTFV
jgi:hypothetical protein